MNSLHHGQVYIYHNRNMVRSIIPSDHPMGKINWNPASLFVKITGKNPKIRHFAGWTDYDISD